MATFIYARVSTNDQDPEAQAHDLKTKYPHDYVVEDVFTGTTTDRPKFKKLLTELKEGDTLIVREVSRLGRNSIEVLALAEDLKKRKVRLHIDNLGIDVTTPAGEMIFTMMTGMAKMERELMLERQRIGIAKARVDGKYKGRKALDPAVVRLAKKLVAEGMTKPAVAKQLRIGLSTLYKYLAA
ncbi:recombinase family protein [Pseudomonas seleniipraecipitans]|uniref:Recombinase family protein n=1 Tax=Phytopseudomonas seleniipraecipitans TaxID=640205 RepID=A0ABY5JDB0_9GAMM|nr:recombinase family protein [Pseudomonas seleniipraecipitans]UUD66066.1 recombinase family protein [Pseudomonas seleniipraecipitans]